MNFKKTKLYNGYFAIIDFGYYQKKIVLNNIPKLIFIFIIWIYKIKKQSNKKYNTICLPTNCAILFEIFLRTINILRNLKSHDLFCIF